MINRLLVAATAAIVVLGVATPASAQQFTPGSSGLGDPLYPLAGNGGYDVRSYKLDIDYERATNHMNSRAKIRARATST